MAGNEYVNFSNSAFLCESMASDRNFSIAYFMKENNCFPEGVDVGRILDLYFQVFEC